MSPLTCHEAELSLGFLALGRDVDGVDEVDEHLQTCPRCRDLLAELSETVDLMALTDADEVARATESAIRTPARRGGEPAAHKPGESRTTTGWPVRHRLAVAGASLLAAAATVAAVLLGSGVVPMGRGPGPAAVRVQATDPHTQVDLAAVLRPTEEGTQIRLRLRGVPSRETCRLVVVGADGHRTVAASWLATYEGTAEVTGTTSLAQSQIARLVIDTLDGQTLVSAPVRS